MVVQWGIYICVCVCVCVCGWVGVVRRARMLSVGMGKEQRRKKGGGGIGNVRCGGIPLGL